MKRTLAAAAIALLALTGCSSDPEEAPETSETEVTTPAETTETEEPEAEPAEPEVEAAKIGTPVVAGDWEVTINSWTADADAAVLEASGGVDVPDEGKQFAVMNVTMKYNGEGTGDNANVQILYVPDSDGVAAGLWEAFGTTPGENKLTYETLTPGGEVTGDALYLIDADTTGTFEVYAGNEEPVVVTP
ncbi:DUF4352 domain-containing protein [Leucobacter chromiiresistens]|uniref:DUF4352 domain-containing protein n=1 Tax=Leucobacter chromiiresistens TaxID=1079994 RepID=A0A1H0XQY9_9MICO|nr:DUF4352 domain-containing protein [Leucobacter chromiiresistens]SDQ05086.1 protein of unknown function [Leucobacter chromiiresistens]